MSKRHRKKKKNEKSYQQFHSTATITVFQVASVSVEVSHGKRMKGGEREGERDEKNISFTKQWNNSRDSRVMM